MTEVQPNDVAVGLPPAPPPVDSREARDALACPLCGYSLRGHAAAGAASGRCPECGYHFEWAELLVARQHAHPYLFEQHPGRNTRSFLKTLIGGLRPRRFWSSLNAAHAVRPRRLMLYWAVAALVILLSGAGGWYAVTAASLYRENKQSRDYYQAFPAGGRGATWTANAFPLPPDRRFFLRVWDQQYHRQLDAQVSVACLAWPWLSLATLLIFRAALRRARIQPGHVMRCVVYSGDVFLWIGAVAAILGWTGGFVRRDFAGGQGIAARQALGGLALLVAVFTYRLGVAYRRYLRLDHPWSTVILSQAVVMLFVVTALSVLARDFFWLIL
jgi:hypothetical protein